MADLFSAIKQIVEYGLNIKEKLEKAGHNAEECRRIGDLLHTPSAIAKHLQGSPKIMEDDSMRDTAEGLRQALQRASKFVTKCQGKGLLSRAFNADDITQKLREVCLDVLLNMTAVLLANSALNNSVLAELKENLAHLRADITYTNSMLAKILQIVAVQPDVHLPKEIDGVAAAPLRGRRGSPDVLPRPPLLPVCWTSTLRSAGEGAADACARSAARSGRRWASSRGRNCGGGR